LSGGATDLKCISCDEPAVKWAERPPTAAEKPHRTATRLSHSDALG